MYVSIMDKLPFYTLSTLINIQDFRKIEESLERIKDNPKIHTKKFIIREYIKITEASSSRFFEKEMSGLYRKFKDIV